MTRALITGITGQDGTYLAELLLAEGVEVHGTIVPRTGSRVRFSGETGAESHDSPRHADAERETSGEANIAAEVELHELDLAEPGIGQLVRQLKPDAVFNLAAVSSVYRSWQQPELTARVNGLAVAELLAAVQQLPDCRFVQASSAEIFGMPETSPQHESTPIRPSSPYGAAKAYAHGLVGVYRTAGVHASSLILYNHESPRRPETFVTRKITAAAARIALGQQQRLSLGNLAARRDWGWAPDYADALLRASRAETPGDYVIATGVTHSVEDFVRLAFERAGIADWRSVVDLDESLLRSGDPAEQRGDASLAREVLGWAPTLDFEGVVAAMVDADLELARGSAG